MFTSMTVSTWIPAEASILHSLEGLRCLQQQREPVLNPPPPPQRPAGLAASQGRNGTASKHMLTPPPATGRTPHLPPSVQSERWERETTLLTSTLWNADPLFRVSAFIRPKPDRKLKIKRHRCNRRYVLLLFLFHPWQVLIYFFVSCAVFIFFC